MLVIIGVVLGLFRKYKDYSINVTLHLTNRDHGAAVIDDIINNVPFMVLPRKSDEVVYNGRLYTVEKVIFDKNNSENEKILIVLEIENDCELKSRYSFVK